MLARARLPRQSVDAQELHGLVRGDSHVPSIATLLEQMQVLACRFIVGVNGGRHRLHNVVDYEFDDAV